MGKSQKHYELRRETLEAVERGKKEEETAAVLLHLPHVYDFLRLTSEFVVLLALPSSVLSIIVRA